MGYVGTAPLSGDYRKLDDISSGFNGVETAFALQVGSVNVTPPKATAVLISVGGILQEPVSAYDISVSTITFTAPPAAGADFFGVMLGAGVDVGTPGDDTVTLAKMAAGTDGNIISYDASGNPVAVATGSAGQVLTSAGAGAPPTFAAAGGGGITEADSWRLHTSLTTTGSTQYLTANLERDDTQGFGLLGTGMTQSSGVFTFPSIGYWKVTFNLVATWNGSAGASNLYLNYTADNSAYEAATSSHFNSGASGVNTAGSVSAIFDITDLSNQKVKFSSIIQSGSSIIGGSTRNYTYFTFIKLAAT